MNAFRRIRVRAGIFIRITLLQLWIILISGFLLYPGLAVAGESEAANCSVFIEYPALYDDCLQNTSTLNADTDSVLAVVNDSDKPCSCDIRKQQQVEWRLQKKAEQAAKQDRIIFGSNARPR
jgi:hypothetical protein